MRWAFLNRYLLLLAFNVLNVVAFGAIVSVAVVNIVDHKAPTNLIIYYAYTGLLSLSLLLSEVRAPRSLNSQARFLFTYTGRGIVLTYFGCIVYTNKLFNVIACIYTVSLGVVYLVVAWVPFIPIQHGLLYNWSRWRQEGSAQPNDTAEAEQNAKEDADERDLSLQKTHHTSLPPLVNHMHNRSQMSVQSIVWPTPLKGPAEPIPENPPNDSFVYGLTVRAERPESTGDAYLDSIVNSSRFAREVMDPNDDSIVVLDGQGLAADAGYRAERRSHTSLAATRQSQHSSLAAHRPLTAAGHYRQTGAHLPISSPMPYHVFAPGSREALAENLAHIDRELGQPTGGFSR
ncbi:hypothetical protein H4R22_002972 [Coemansia sp. RSA 1290]|nr:hypothetical protein H4R22_002972 [Coemansia sp. RSA 1290]